MQTSNDIERHAEEARVRRTLERGWSNWLGGDVRVNSTCSPEGVAWRQHPVWPLIYPRNASPAVRRFIADAFRFTPFALRVVPQFVLGTVLAAKPVLERFGRPAFWASVSAEQARHQLVLPGNRRVRVLDFQRRRSRVFSLEGHTARANLREIEVRGGKQGPFLELEAWAEGGEWLEEPLIEGFTLPRCPPWLNARGYRDRAFRALDAWLDAHRGEANAAEYAAELADELHTAIRDDEWDASLGRLIARMKALAAGLGTLPLASTHGDFQPGNVFVDTAGDRVFLHDWEYSARRCRHYDALVWGLESRICKDLAANVAAFVRQGQLHGGANRLLGAVASTRWRRSLAAVFLLEELCWAVEDARSRHGTLSGRRRTKFENAASYLARDAEHSRS